MSPFSRVEREKEAERVWGARRGSPQAVEGIDLSGACNALKCLGGWIRRALLSKAYCSVLYFLKGERWERGRVGGCVHRVRDREVPGDKEATRKLPWLHCETLALLQSIHIE